MKKFILLIVSILIYTGAQSIFANTDYPQTNIVSYSCDANGEGTLYLTFGGNDSKNAPAAQKHHIDVRAYRINYPGIVTIYNTNRNYAYADILASDGVRVPGCTKACELGPISGNQTIWPIGWSHAVNGWGQVEGDETSPDAYVFTPNYWPYYVQAKSGWGWVWNGSGWERQDYAEGWGQTKWINDILVGFGTTAVTFIPDGNGMGNCAKCSSGINPITVYESTITPACDNGTVVNPTSSTDSTNKTTYTWSCSSGGGTNASCTAQSKPVTDPPQCDETRRVSQCMYSMAGGETLSLGTSDGPTTIGINSTTASLPGYAPGTCRAPVAGVKPRVVCDGYSGTIESSLTSFTLPSDVTRKPGKCSVIFDDPGYCYPRSKDTVEIKAKADPTCLGLTETDALKKPECTATVTDKVCIAIKDKYGNPVEKIEADKVTTSLKYVLSATPTNTYYKKNSSIVYVPGTFIQVSPGVVCAPKCDKDHPELCECQELGTCPPPPPPSCTSTNTCTTCADSNTCPPPVCIPSLANNNCGDPIVTTITDNTCTPSILNNYCKEPGPVTTVPGGDIITARKTCTGNIEVWNGAAWTKDGSTILYDQPYDYRIFIDGADPVCSNGVVSLSAIAVMGGAFTGGLTYSAADTFRATITKTSTSTPTTPRGVSVKAMFTQPGGGVLKVIPYGLTTDPLDFLDNPIQITGDRMKGVRVIGNTAGTNIGEFNLNNGWVVAEQGPITNAARSTMLQNTALVTRGITAGTVVNGILYIEGDINYESPIIKNAVFQTLIVRGNLTIDANIGSTTNTDGKGIIVLANSTGNAGNIIIGDGVRIIHALVFAEGTLRGVSTLASQLNQSIQLVIKGSLFSRNTIGGSADSTNSNDPNLTRLYLAGGAKTTDLNAAFIQDLNNVRNGIEYNPDGSPLNPYKGYSDPFIIDYDPALRLLGLPGFTN